MLSKYEKRAWPMQIAASFPSYLGQIKATCSTGRTMNVTREGAIFPRSVLTSVDDRLGLLQFPDSAVSLNSGYFDSY